MADKPTPLTLEDISILDKQVDMISEFKPIPEHEVKVLCDKVSETLVQVNYALGCRLKKF